MSSTVIGILCLLLSIVTWIRRREMNKEEIVLGIAIIFWVLGFLLLDIG